jgi:hypothetical protein
MLTKCQCEHCWKPVEFEAESFKYGTKVECPHCSQITTLRMPRGRVWTPAPTFRTGEVSETMIGLSYVSAVLMPFIGFFMGLYLLTKKESGHGLTCIALSIVIFSVALYLLMGG